MIVEGEEDSAAEVVVIEVDEELQEEAAEVSFYTLPAELCLPIRLGQSNAFFLDLSGAKSENKIG